MLQPRCERDIVLLNGATPLLRWNVARSGVPLFTASPGVWASFRSRARRDYEETAPFQERPWQALRRRLGLVTAPSDGEFQQKLASRVAYADELGEWLASPPDPARPRALQRIVERLVQVIVECAADAGDLWLVERGHPGGESVWGLFRRLWEVGIIDSGLKQRFAAHTRARNRIVHDYDRRDAADLIAQATSLPDDARALARTLASP